MVLDSMIMLIIRLVMYFMCFEKRSFKQIGIIAAISSGIVLLTGNVYSSLIESLLLFLLWLVAAYVVTRDMNQAILAASLPFANDFLINKMDFGGQWLIMSYSFEVYLLVTGVIVFICSLLLTCIEQGVFRWLKKRKHQRVIKNIPLLFLVLFCVYIAQSFYFEYSLIYREESTIQVLVTIFSTIVFLFVVSYKLFSHYLEGRIQLEREQVQYEANKRYVTDIEQQYKEMRRFKHDYLNILSSVEQYLERGEYERLKTYFYQQIKPTSKKLAQQGTQLAALANIKNLEIKSILYAKLASIDLQEIQLSLEIKDEVELSSQNSLALVRCLGIILDNAIEELQLAGAGKLQVAFIHHLQEVVIVVANSCQGEVLPLYQLQKEGFSTKGDGRGLGLTNLKQIMNEQTTLMLDTECKEGLFTQKITILQGEGD